MVLCICFLSFFFLFEFTRGLFILSIFSENHLLDLTLKATFGVLIKLEEGEVRTITKY